MSSLSSKNINTTSVKTFKLSVISANIISSTNNNNSNNSNNNDSNKSNNNNNNSTVPPNLRHHVFMSKETTKELSEYILPEEWGYQAGLLYKYLDYIWRCQIYDEQVKLFTFYGEEKLVFHSGLQRRSDAESIYIILVKNDAYNPYKKGIEQRWRVSFGQSIGKEIKNISFATKSDLVNIWKLNENDIPKRTIFHKEISELLFNPHYGFKIDWDERLRTCKTRIFKQIGLKNNDRSLSTKHLKSLFDAETKRVLKLAKNNPRIAVPQAFIETKNLNRGYHLELLIPLTLKFNGKKQYFALALRPFHKNKFYEGMSILTRKMAYANARLVGGIDSSWLLNAFAKSNTYIKNYNGYDDPNPSMKVFQSKLGDIPSTPSHPSGNDSNHSVSSISQDDCMILPRLNHLATKSNQSNISNDSSIFASINHNKYNHYSNTIFPLPNIRSISAESKSNTITNLSNNSILRNNNINNNNSNNNNISNNSNILNSNNNSYSANILSNTIPMPPFNSLNNIQFNSNVNPNLNPIPNLNLLLSNPHPGLYNFPQPSSTHTSTNNNILSQNNNSNTIPNYSIPNIKDITKQNININTSNIIQNHNNNNNNSNNNNINKFTRQTGAN